MSRVALGLDRVVSLADEVAADWAALGRARTSAGCERAVLRLFGVDGLDRAGKPLAWSVVERYAGRSPERLEGGLALPFAIGLLEYDVDPQQLALDVAGGVVDLAFEARLLAEPDRRATAEAEACRLLAAATERIDANRTARAELRSVLGDADAPWLGVPLAVRTALEARQVGPAVVRAGADVVLVETPSGRELVERLSVAGLEVVRWAPPDPATSHQWRDERASAQSDPEPAPPGSQRGLAALRRALDEAAAERGAYVRMATSAPALGAPEQAVVAVLERVDLVVADPVREIVEEAVDPLRAITDHVFAERLVRRSGAQLVVGPGPLLIGPDLATGRPSDAAVRLGRALALLAVSVAFARRAGFAPADVVVDALPAWLAEEAEPLRLALAAVVVERALFPEHPLALRQAGGATELFSPTGWPALVAGLLPAAAPVGLVVVGDVDAEAVGRVAVGLRTAAGLAAALPPTAPGALRDPEATIIERAVEAGAAYLSDLRSLGPSAIQEATAAMTGGDGRRPRGSGAVIGGGRPAGFGGDGVAERRAAFDPITRIER